jgi:hypothetical protein
VDVITNKVLFHKGTQVLVDIWIDKNTDANWLGLLHRSYTMLKDISSASSNT